MTAINSLALIALKCAPNVFDLSSDMTHASIRDQVVRARLLARDLAQLPKPPQSVLVVGAGFAGVSVAMALAAQKIKVLVVEVNRQPFQLQSKVSDRYVAPFMYEWPSHNADDQSYPPAGAPAWSDDSILAGLWDAPAIATLKQAGRDRGAWRKRWKRLHGVRSHGPYPAEPPHWDEWFVRELRGQVPLPAKELARRARARLLEHLAAIPPTSAQLKILTRVDADAIKRFVGAFAKQMGSWYQSMSSPPIPGSYRPWQHLRVATGVDWLTSQPEHNVPCDVDAVILGGGAGPERVELDAYPFKFDAVGPAAGLSFWDNDGWLGASADDHVGVFGAGDGALQDALRALTGHKHPLMTIHAIRRDPRARAALTAVEPELAAIDRQNWLAASWTQVSEEKGSRVFIAVCWMKYWISVVARLHAGCRSSRASIKRWRTSCSPEPAWCTTCSRKIISPSRICSIGSCCTSSTSVSRRAGGWRARSATARCLTWPRYAVTRVASYRRARATNVRTIEYG